MSKYKEIDWCYCNDKKIPNLPNDDDTGGRFKDSIRCSNLTYKGPYQAIILKENGVKIKDKFLLCVDIDCKNDRGNTKEEQEELFAKVKEILNVNKWYPHFENSQNGGYHIWFYITKEDYERVKGLKAIRVETVENKKVAKKEIEFFTVNQAVILYKEIDLYSLDTITYYDIDMLYQLKEYKSEYNNLNTEEDFVEEEKTAVSGTNILKKAVSDIPEISLFVKGEWLGYEYTYREIMRFYIALNKEDEFIKVISEKHLPYINVWKNYPKNYLNFTNNKRNSTKNSDHEKWLLELGYYKKKASSKEDKIKNADLSMFLTDTISMNSEIAFYWNGKCYEVLEPTGIKNKLFEYYENKGVYCNEELLTETYMRTYRMALSRAEEYNLVKDNRFMEKVSLTFSNGTLYITPEKIIFKENEFLPDNRCFTHFIVPYENNEKMQRDENSIVLEWLENRFETQEDKNFFIMSISDLLVTQNNSEILPFFYGEAGKGKTIFLEAMQNILKRDTVSSLSVNDFNGRFSKVALLKSCINMSSEISRRSVNSDIFKRIISREIIEMEYKGVQGLMGRPLAKHIAVANDIPEIDLDSGVERRFCVIKIKSEKLRSDLSKNEYKYTFFQDYKTLVGCIILGIQGLQINKFDLAGYYEKNISKDNKEEFLQRNDTVRFFVKEVYEPDENFEGYTTKEMLEHFNVFLKKTEGTALKRLSLQTLGRRIADIKLTKKANMRRNGYPVQVNKGLKLKLHWERMVAAAEYEEMNRQNNEREEHDF